MTLHWHKALESGELDEGRHGRAHAEHVGAGREGEELGALELALVPAERLGVLAERHRVDAVELENVEPDRAVLVRIRREDQGHGGREVPRRALPLRAVQEQAVL